MSAAGRADGALEENMKKYLLIIFVFSLLLIGCSKNTEQLYEKMMNVSKDSKQKIYLSFFEINRSSGNKYYDKIIIDFSHSRLHRAKMFSDSRFRIK